MSDPFSGSGDMLIHRQIWRDLGVPENHILPGNAKDNFWGAYNPRIRQHRS